MEDECSVRSSCILQLWRMSVLLGHRDQVQLWVPSKNWMVSELENLLSRYYMFLVVEGAMKLWISRINFFLVWDLHWVAKIELFFLDWSNPPLRNYPSGNLIKMLGWARHFYLSAAIHLWSNILSFEVMFCTRQGPKGLSRDIIYGRILVLTCNFLLHFFQ